MRRSIPTAALALALILSAATAARGFEKKVVLAENLGATW